MTYMFGRIVRHPSRSRGPVSAWLLFDCHCYCAMVASKCMATYVTILMCVSAFGAMQFGAATRILL